MTKKILSATVCLMLAASLLAAQEQNSSAPLADSAPAAPDQQTETPAADASVTSETEAPQFHLFTTTYDKPASFGAFMRQIHPSFYMEPVFILNTASSLISAPSPIVYPLSLGLVWPYGFFITFQPRLSFYMNYYLWDSADSRALPAEIESRTATSLSFLIDVPAVLTFNVNSRNKAEYSLGAAFLLRFAVPSLAVNDPEEVELIRQWFWDKARYLYLQTGVAWLFKCTDTIQAGPEFRFYLPIGSLAEDRGMDAMLISAGLKIVF